jgi:hypothetical protein
MENLCA